jgi:hypothetical protein
MLNLITSEVVESRRLMLNAELRLPEGTPRAWEEYEN